MANADTGNQRGFIYWFCRIAVSLLAKCVFRLRISGLENLPRNQPVVLASNHIHNFDPPFLGANLPRHIRFMAKSELFKNRLAAIFLTVLGAFPVRRGGQDKAAIRKAIDITKAGGCLLVFPEGHRSKDGKLGTPQPGIAFIARRAGCPIVPSVLIGSYKLFRPMSLRIGQPIFLTGDDTNETVLDKLMESLNKLLAEGPIQK